MTENTFKQGMAGLYEYYKKDASLALSSVYWRALKHLTDNDFMQAVDGHILESNWFPKIPELLALAPEQLSLENKGSLTWCDNTTKLVERHKKDVEVARAEFHQEQLDKKREEEVKA